LETLELVNTVASRLRIGDLIEETSLGFDSSHVWSVGNWGIFMEAGLVLGLVDFVGELDLVNLGLFLVICLFV
jgi:hypothetical protein